jgi:ribosome biogenesis protein SSF1/2
MAKKRAKKRTHVRKADNPTDPKIPKSFVIRTGKTTVDPLSSVLAQLVLDVRRIMEPNTASRLRVRIPDLCAGAYEIGTTCQ